MFAATGNEIRNSNIKCRRKVYYTFYHSFLPGCERTSACAQRMCFMQMQIGYVSGIAVHHVFTPARNAKANSVNFPRQLISLENVKYLNVVLL